LSSINSSKVVVGTEVTQLVHDTTAGSAKEDGRITYQILNNSSATIWLGGDDVTVEAGTPLPAGAVFTIALRLLGKLYAIGTLVDHDIRILKVV